MGTATRTDEKTNPDLTQQDRQEASLDRSDVFHLLQNNRRRAVVRYFATVGGPATIGDLSEQIAAWECEVPLEDVTKDQRQRVYIALYQSHLDKLDETGVINYADTGDQITTGPNFERLARQLAATAETIPTPTGSATAETDESTMAGLWPSCYLGVAVGGILPLVAHSLEVVPQQLLTLEALNVVLVVTYVSLATAQFLMTRN